MILDSVVDYLMGSQRSGDLYGNDEQVNKMLKLCSMMAAGTKTDLRAEPWQQMVRLP